MRVNDNYSELPLFLEPAHLLGFLFFLVSFRRIWALFWLWIEAFLDNGSEWSWLWEFDLGDGQTRLFQDRFGGFRHLSFIIFFDSLHHSTQISWGLGNHFLLLSLSDTCILDIKVKRRFCLVILLLIKELMSQLLKLSLLDLLSCLLRLCFLFLIFDKFDNFKFSFLIIACFRFSIVISKFTKQLI